jgi:ribosomal protein S18 acetylase RimI-like enzyme
MGPEATLLRSARRGDVTALAALHRALLADEARPPAPGFDARRYMARRLRRDDLFLAVAERSGQVVGYVEGALLPNGEGAICYAFVDPAARGAGVGRQLVAHMVGHLRARGVRRIHSHVRAGNEASLAMLRACGFAVSALELVSE